MKLTYKCELCSNVYNHSFTMVRHINKFHPTITPQEYYDKYLKKPNEGICPVCGGQTKFKSFKDGYKIYCSETCLMRTDEMKNKIREGMKNSEHWQEVLKSEEYHKNLSNSIKNSKYITEIVKTDEYKERMRNSIKNSEKHKNSLNTKEYKELRSKMSSKMAAEGKLHPIYSYDNIKFMSSPELAYYIWLKDHKIDFKYQCEPILYEFEGQKKRYVPDFEVNGELQEIKGLHFFENGDQNGKMINPYDRKQDSRYEAKHQCMIKNNVKIITDYSEYIKYVESNYGIDFFTNHKLSK